MNKLKFGEPGYKEQVDFQKLIGYYVDKTTKKQYPTTIGTIHYSKKGAHIVPARPNNWIKINSSKTN